MPDPAYITDRDGLRAVIESEEGDRVRLRLDSGVSVDLPRALVVSDADGALGADVSFTALGADRAVLQEVEERLIIGTDIRETGRVSARTVTETVREAVDVSGWRETVDVERVPVGRAVDAVEAPRVEGDVTVVPVYEEVLVVTKQLVLREEVRLTRRREQTAPPAPVELRRQRVEVERTPPDPAG